MARVQPPCPRAVSLLAAVGLTLLAASPARAIVGGTPVPAGSRGAVANLLIGGSPQCTGTLVAPDWVLTAGHCASISGSLTQGQADSPVPFPTSSLTVQLGTVNADGSGGERHAIAQVVVNPSFVAPNGAYAYDSALLRLAAPSAQAPILVAARSERASWAPGMPVTEVGFGTTAEDSSVRPPTLREVTVPIVPDAECAADYPSDPQSTLAHDGAFDARVMVCAGLSQGGKDSCEGDSGGPLLAAVDGDVPRVVGTTSTGNGCARPGFPGISARVADSPLRDWIGSVVPAALAPEVSHHAAPVVSTLRLSPTRFRARPRGGVILPAGTSLSRGGTRLQVRTTPAGGVLLLVRRLGDRHPVTVMRIRERRTSLRLSGRERVHPHRHRGLRPGAYLLTARPLAAGGQARSVRFRVLAPRR